MKNFEKLLYPVIHTLNKNQVTDNAHIAIDNGADGIFLVNHGHNTTREIFEVFYPEVKKITGDKFVGVNDLSLIHHPEKVVEKAALHDVDGIRVDNPMIHSDKFGINIAENTQKIKETLGRDGVYFGGVNFKHQTQLSSEMLEKHKPQYSKYLDVIVTSGSRTGVAAQPIDIKEFHQIFSDNLTAIASGITPQNISDYIKFVDIFIVATGISYDFYNLNPRKVQQLSRLIESFNEGNNLLQYIDK